MFSSLTRVKIISAQILAGFPLVLGRSFRTCDVCALKVSLDQPALVKLWEYRDPREVTANNCYASGILESIEGIKAISPNGCLPGVVTPTKSLDVFFVHCTHHAEGQL